MIMIRQPHEIYRIEGAIQNGTFHGRWHFSFGDYYDPEFERFGVLRVFNDDTLSPGAIWPLHPHRDNEVVTYCAAGEFKHADERGLGGILKQGWVQHTTVGRGMWHSEINNRPDEPLRFIQMWFLPAERGREPSVEQKAVEKKDRTNRFFPLVSNRHPGALRIISDAEVYSVFVERGRTVSHDVTAGRGVYLYVLDGSPVDVSGREVPVLGAVMATDEKELAVRASGDTELLLIDVLMI